MAAIAPALPFIAAGATVGSTIMSYVGQQNAMKASEQEDNYVAQEDKMQATQEQAASERTMLNEQRNKQLTESTALANAAASGGGASDPGVVNIMGDLEEQGDYREQMALYDGDSKAAALNQDAKLKQYSASVTASQAPIAGAATLLGGASSIMSKFAPGPAPGTGGSNAVGGEGAWNGYSEDHMAADTDFDNLMVAG